jgi:hypothetical protein
MGVKLVSASAGSVEIVAPTTASNFTATLPATTGTVMVQTATGSSIASGTKYQVNGTTVSALAWVNFNGTGTVAIRSSYNVSSITDNGTGDYTVNFTTALSDANYCFTGNTTGVVSGNTTRAVVVKGSDAGGATTKTASAIAIQSGGTASASLVDMAEIYVAIFGN